MATRRPEAERPDRAGETVVDARAGTLPEVGTVVAGKYRVDRLIGTGAMGAVFAATHEALGRQVAIKMMWKEHLDAPDLVSRFFNEARAAARIESEHIARIFDVGQTDNGSPFIVLELLDGADLAQTLESRGPLPVPELVGWILQALEGIAEAHSMGIVHRDLKPANLFLAHKRDGTSIVKVLDFGISKDQRTSAGPALTVTTTMLGSPAYMAPEQLRDARTADARTDIWATGVVLYELLSGGLPFRASNVADLCVAILEHDVAPLESHRPDVPPGLDVVVRRCLARDPAERFPDVAALAEALAPFASPADSDLAAERIRHLLRTVRCGPLQDTRRRRPSRLRLVAALAATASLVAIVARCLVTAPTTGWARDRPHSSEATSPSQQAH
jgi:serine/threonine-protein kinase